MKPTRTSYIPVVCLYVWLLPTTLAQSVTDQDGHTYSTTKIRDQAWMGQNLDVSHFRNGDPIPEVTTDEEWEKAGLERKPAWCYYEGNAEQGKTYGKLYNWYAVHDSRGLAPKGWHIPTEQEWMELSKSLGGDELAGKKLKEKGTAHWKSPDQGATNESGFSALPGGLNYSFGTFVDMGITGYWWTSTANGEETAILYSLSYKDSVLTNLFLNKGVGISVRCVKD